MPKASPIQFSFNAGELSPQFIGRIDIQKYKNGCQTLENFLPQIHGPIRKRPGTRFVNEVKTSANNARLLPFQFSNEQAYVLEFGDQYIRFYKNGGVIESTPSTPYEIATPYLHTELSDLKFAQSADVLYLAHPNHPPQKLSRFGDTNWTVSEVVFDWPAFNDLEVNSVTMTASATTGSGITLTASASVFATTDVNTYIKIEETSASKYNKWEVSKSISSGDIRIYEGNVYQAGNSATTGSRPPIHTEGTESDGAVNWTFLHSGSGYVKITGYTSATVVTVDVIRRIPESALSSGTEKWAWAAWSDTFGWPRSVSFYEDRLWFAGNVNKPQTLWASTSGDYESHQYGSNDDDALNYTINSQEVNTILWMSPGKSLMVGTSGGEFIVAASSSDQAITPSNVRITPQTSFGVSTISPFRIGNAVLFIQRSQRKLREFTYNFETDAYVAPNMVLLSEHILQGGAVDMAYQQEPYQILWIPDANGDLLGLTYERTEDVVGWHRHTLSGNVESVVTVPHWDGDQDVTWLLVERTINGGTKRYIEYIEKYLEDDHALFLDSALTYDGAAATVISGLDHLEGETVSVLTDGYVHPDTIVTSGQITLNVQASVVSIGLGFNATMKSMPIEAGAGEGVAQGKTQRINNIVVRLYNTGPGLHYGPDTANMNEYHTRGSTDLMDNPVPLFTGDTEALPWPDVYTQAPAVTLQHRTPLPCTITAFMPQVTTYDR